MAKALDKNIIADSVTYFFAEIGKLKNIMNFESQDQSLQVVIFRSALIAGACLILLILLSLKSVVPAIERELLAQVSQQFINNKLNNILVSAQGQDVFLEGLVTTDVRNTALDLASKVRGVRKVHDNFIITDSKTASKNEAGNNNQ